MLKILIKSLLISSLVFAFHGGIMAQARDNSPFSQFGLGDFLDSDLPSSHAMGGLNAIFHDFYEVNLENPASLGFLQYTTLQVGTSAKRSNYTRIDEKQSVWNGNMNHLSLNIPIINPLNKSLERQETEFAWGTSFSLRPFSQVGYDVRINDEIDTIGNVQRNFEGSGGLYQITWANGWKYKNLSVGLNLTLLKGKQTFSEITYFEDLENAYDDYFQSSIAYDGFSYRLGVMYEQPLGLKEAREKDENPSKLFTIGLYLNSKNNLNTESDESRLAINELINDIDTGFYETGIQGKGMLPSSLGFGLLYHHAGKFRVGIDYRSSPWSKYENDARPETMMDASRFGAGVGWIPDAENISSYFQRVEYRLGFYTKKDPRIIEDAQVEEFALTLGASFPFILQRSISWVQFGLDFGKRTGGENLTDNFMRFNIGLVFNDNAWFIRGRYD